MRSKGKKMAIKAHNGLTTLRDVVAIAIAIVNDKLQLTKVEVFFDHMAMLRQMAAQINIMKEQVAAT